MESLTPLSLGQEQISIGKFLKKCDLDMGGADSTLHKRDIKAKKKDDGMQFSIPIFYML